MNRFFTLMLFSIFTIICNSGSIYAQFTVKGTVKNTDGETLIGVSIVAKNTAIGTLSDLDGQFSLDLPGNSATLLITYVGYTPFEQVVNSSTGNLNVTLEQGLNTLNEVVVSGLATTIKRSNIANAVSSISTQELTGITSQPTMDGALYGKFTGAVINSNSGAPGGGISIRLRGVTTIVGESQPLYIVDGVYYDNSAIPAGLNTVSKAAAGGSASNQDNPSNRIADLDPEDIERIEILKGASAAAIYGSRAASGVVLITTKKGSAGKTNVSISQSIGMNMLLRKLGTRSWDTTKVRKSLGQARVNDYLDAVSKGINYDYEDELYGNTGLTRTSRITLGGGNDKTKFFAGFTAKNDKGIVENTGYDKKSFRLNLDHKFNKNVDIAFANNYVISSADRGYFNNDNTSTTLGVSFVSTPSWVELHPVNGVYPDNPFAPANFLQTANLITNNEGINRLLSGITLTLKLLTRDNMTLQLIGKGGLDQYTLTTRAIFPKDLQFEKSTAANSLNGVSILGTTTSAANNFSTFLVHSLYVNKLSFRSQLGVTQENRSQNQALITATNLIGTQTNVDQAANRDVAQTRIKQVDSGFFAQEEVNYDDKIIATIGLRGDKSSNNGDVNKLYYYPKASIAVNVHNFVSLGFFNELKLRAAYGQSGNFAPFGFKYISLQNNSINGGAGTIPALTSGKPNIEPERQSETELGLDVALLKNKISADITYYIKGVNNLIFNANTPTSTGFSSKVDNIGNLENKGIELGISYNAITNEKVDWYGRVSFWKNKSKITKLTVPAFFVPGGGFGATLGGFYLEEGKSATQILGIDAAQGEGRFVVGDGEPDFNLSWQNNLSLFKNIDFSFLLHWKKGGNNINLSTLLSDLSGTTPDFDEKTLDPKGELTNGEYRVSQLGSSATVFVEDASYLRLREIGLYYNLPKKIFNDNCSLRFGVSGRNLINIFDYYSYDPEVSNFGNNGISSGVEVTPFPSSKSVNFSVMANF